MYLPQHYSAWQLTGSCPDALAVLAVSMGQCLLTWTMQMMWYSLHRIKAGGMTMGLHTPWEKTKLQNIGYGLPPQSVSVNGCPVEVTDKLVYLGSTVDSTGYSNTDIHR